MIVYNFSCESGHHFEGWFDSRDDYDRQRARGLLSCPQCDSQSLSKLPAAPRINKGHPEPAVAQRAPSRTSQGVAAAEASTMMRWLIRQFEDVGSRFPDEARRMHYGEKPFRNIRGAVSPDVANELREEGIDCRSLPPGFDLPEKLT